MSLKNNPLSDVTDEARPEKEEKEVVLCKTAYGEVTQLVHEDQKGTILYGIKNIGMFLLESLWGGIREIANVAAGITVLILLVVIFVCMPIIAVGAFTEGHWIIGIISTIVSLTAWGAVLNENNNR